MGLGAFGSVIGMFVSGLLVSKYGTYISPIALISIAGAVGLACSCMLKQAKAAKVIA